MSSERRWPTAPTITCVVRVPCLSSSRAPGRSGFSASQHRVASSSSVTRGGWAAEASTSPREMSMSSSSSTVTLRPARGRRQRAVGGLDRRHRGAGAAGQHHDLVARPPRCRRRPGRRSRGSRAGLRVRRRGTRIGAVPRADHVLHRHPERRPHLRAGDRHRLEVPEQRRPVVPGGALGAIHDVVPDQRRDRDRDDGVVGEAERTGEPGEVLRDRGEDRLVVVDEVDLVDGQHEPRDAQQREHGGVPAGLLHHAVAGVDEQHGQLRGGRAGDGVARVLHVARGVGQHELTRRGAEVAVCDVDRDALLALGAQPVDQQRQVRCGQPLVDRGALHGLDLVGEHRLGVVQQPSDQRGLAVVDAARGGEAEQIPAVRGHLRSTPHACGLPSRPRTAGRRRGWPRAR